MANLVATTFTGDVSLNGNGTLRANGQVDATSFTGNGAGLTGVDPFESGTKMVFYQASAPTGWTQDTAAALSNTVMSVVTGTGGGTGGSTSYFSSFLATTNKSGTDSAPVSGSVSGTVGGTTLSTPTIANHRHAFKAFFGSPNGSPVPTPYATMPQQGRGQGAYVFPDSDPLDYVQPAGGGGSHSHPFSGSLASATADVSVTVPAANVKYANVIVAAKD